MTLGSVALTADRPDGVWSDPVVICSRIQEPAGYAPSVHPWNDNLEDAYFHNSSWQQVPDPVWAVQHPWETLHGDKRMISVDYCTKGYRGSLVAEASPQAAEVTEKSRVLSVDTHAMSADECGAYVRRVQDASAEVNGR